jgi:flavin-dependent dehydrogenase
MKREACLLASAAELHDVAVIGGGPAGSALAALLARSGRRVALIERDCFPRDKLCGEFLSGEAVSLLEAVGCRERVLALRPASIRRVRFTTGGGRRLELDLPQPGLGLSRRALDEALFRHAVDSGVEAFTGIEVVKVAPEDGPIHRAGAAPLVRLDLRAGSGEEAAAGSLAARLVAGAWGRRQRLDRQLGRAFLRERSPYVGLQRHHRPRAAAAGPGLGEYVEVHAFGGGYCGLSAIETGAVNLCMLLEGRFLKRLASTRWEALADALRRANPSLARRLDELEPEEEAVQAVAQVSFRRKELRAGPILFLGDAAGMIAPVCGGGQAMALESALLLHELITSMPRAPSAGDIERLGLLWERRWRRAFGRRLRLGRLLQPLFLRTAAAEGAAALFKRLPGLAALAVRWTRGGRAVAESVAARA